MNEDENKNTGENYEKNYYNRRYHRKKHKKFVACCIVVATILLFWKFLCFNVDMNLNECDFCGKEWIGNSYYGMNYNDTLCKKCAQRYWAPYSYENFEK